MACYRPKPAWENNEGGRPVFHADDPRAGNPLLLPCGKCIGCLTARKGDWGIRSRHEASIYGLRNSFVTLSYDPAFLPVGGVLRPRDFDLFMKRLRKHVEPVRIRYLMCGEYGGETGRPHFHANLFNYFPGDAKEAGMSKTGQQMFSSQELTDIWGFGHVWIERGAAGAYIAGHNEKKAAKLAEVNGDAWRLPGRHCLLQVDSLGRIHPLRDVDGRVVVWIPEYLIGSRDPGIGRAWIEQYAMQTFGRGFVVVDGHETRIPRYYMDVAERGDLEAMTKGYCNSDMVDEVKARRMEEALARDPVDSTPERLKVIEFCKLEGFKRRGSDIH